MNFDLDGTITKAMERNYDRIVLLNDNIVSIVWSKLLYCLLFIILINTIVKLNVILLLCIAIASIACEGYFIHCEILFDLR